MKDRERNPAEATQSIVLLGLKHSGKSSVGERLARRLSLPFVDTDQLIARNTNSESAREVFKREGKTGFMQAERAVCEQLAKQSAERKMVIATGGGIADNHDALEKLTEATHCFYLMEDESVLFGRFMQSGLPAFLSGNRPKEHWAEIYKRRDTCYRKWADHTIECRDKSIDEVVDEVMRRERFS